MNWCSSIFIVSFFLVLCMSGPVSGLMVRTSIEDLSADSDFIITGMVMDAESRWAEDNSIIVTLSNVSVLSVLKGTAAPGSTISIITEGGTVGDARLVVEDEPVFAPGQAYGLFLGEREDHLSQVVGKYQGAIALDGTNGSKIRSGYSSDEFTSLVQRVLAGEPAGTGADAAPKAASISAAAGGPVITSITPGSASAGTGSIVTISGSGFGTKASRDSLADVCFFFLKQNPGADTIPIRASGNNGVAGWQQYNENDIVSWTDTKILVRVPSGWVNLGSSLYQGSASSGPVYIVDDDGQRSNNYPFRITFAYGKNKWLGSNPIVYYQVALRTDDDLHSVEDAISTWNAASNFRFIYSGTTSSQSARKNGINEVIWGATGGSLASTYNWPTPSNGVISECDIVFNKDISWSSNPVGDVYDTEAVMLHEAGHVVGLNDLYGNLPGYASDEQKVMFGLSFPGIGLRSLSADDIAGVRYIYSFTPTPTPTTVPPTTIPTSVPTTKPPTTAPTTIPTTIPTTAPTTAPTTKIPTTVPTTAPTVKPTAGPGVPPAEFYGGVTLNGQPAPSGSVIIGRIQGVERGRITTSTAGAFGGSGAFDERLRVTATQGDISGGSPWITFWLNGIQAAETARFSQATSTEMPLTFMGGGQPTPTSTPTTIPTTKPTTLPTTKPTTVPTTVPTIKPTTIPTTKPPTTVPTTAPTTIPTTPVPTTVPTTWPTTKPPTTVPTVIPTTRPAPSGGISPAEFYGSVTINGDAAPAGSVIIATINGAERGRITTTIPGIYGGRGTFDDRLRVVATQNDLSAGNPPVTFWLNNLQARQSVQFSPASSAELFLEFAGVQPTPTVITQQGILVVTGNPSGASVAIDGVVRGTCPVSLQVPSGVHTVTLAKKGYRDRSTTVTVIPLRRTAVTLNLARG